MSLENRKIEVENDIEIYLVHRGVTIMYNGYLDTIQGFFEIRGCTVHQ
jgi:hypothetical protein